MNNKTLSTTNIDELLIGIVLSNVMAFAINDLVVLFFYKQLKMTGQSMMSAFVIFLIVFLALYTYLNHAPKAVAEEIV